MKQFTNITLITSFTFGAASALSQPIVAGGPFASVDASSVSPSVAAAVGTQNAGALAFDWTGSLTAAKNLAFAVINGDVRFTAPVSGDLPLFVSGELVVSGATPSFTLAGSFTSPTRSYTFDVFVDGFEDDLTVTPNTVVISQAEDNLSFDLVINRQTGVGSFDYVETVNAGGVQLVRSASGTIGGVSVVPSPATASLLLAGSALAVRRKR